MARAVYVFTEPVSGCVGLQKNICALINGFQSYVYWCCCLHIFLPRTAEHVCIKSDIVWTANRETLSLCDRLNE